ncbi:MAG TPA: O-antigen ligase family protein [Vicinamibacterales bacterium]|nr:O-antigen ligase family protein [Vicinamibacterales bacterium]
MSTTAAAARPFGGSIVLPGLLAGGAIIAGAVAGYVVAQQPADLQVQVDFSWPGLALLAAAAVTVFVIIRHPTIGLAILAALIYLNASEVLVREHGWPSFLQLLAIPLLLAAWADRQTPPLRDVLGLPLTRLLGLYVVVLLASSVLARDQALADDRFIEHLKMLVMFVTIVALASARRRLPVLAWTMVAAGALLAAIGVFQALTGGFANEFGGFGRIKYAQIYGTVFEPRIAGPLGDPNFFAQILLVLVPVALALATWERTAWRRVLGYAAAAILVGGTALTYSRGGALALALVAGLSLVDRKHGWRDLGAGVLLLAMLALLLPDNFMRRVTTLDQLISRPEQTLRPDSSFEKRKLLVSTAWRMFLDHPVAGVGAGNYTTRFEDYADEVGFAARDYDDPAERHYPHNLYLEVGAETGVIGLIVFGAVCALALGRLVRARESFHRQGEELSAGIVRGFAIALLGYLVSSIFLHGHFLRYLWLLFAAAAAAHLAAREREPADAPRGRTGSGARA